VICDTTRVDFHFPGLQYDNRLPTIVLYRDDSPTFYAVVVSELAVTRAPEDLTLMKGLYAAAPEINSILHKHTPMRKKDEDTGKLTLNSVYVEVNKLTPTEVFTMEVKPKLNKMRTDELVALAEKCGVSVEKQGKTKMVKKIKKELIEDIIAAYEPGK
jgi:hypothetical protein